MGDLYFPEISLKIEGMEKIKIPRMVKIKQLYDSSKIDDLKSWTRNQLETCFPDNREACFQNKRICITAGSRGIPHLDLIIKTVIDVLRKWGASPFIVPAMGSHGGGTAEGQKEYLKGFNITEETMGVPILSSMDVVKIGTMKDGTPVYCDKNASESDGIIVLNKVKPHTDFRGKHESGLAKMMAIGLAKHKGASMFHMGGFETFAKRIPEAAEVFLKNAPVICGIGIVQNAYDEISELEVMPNSKILERDAALLEIAKQKTPKFKMSSIDVLIIDEIGKNISGNGFDPNIVGRSNSPGFDDVLKLQKLFIRGLSKESHHNGCGIAMADITTRRCLNDIDFTTTWVNVITSTRLNGGRIPMYANNDKEALLIAIRTCVGIDFDKVKIVRTKNTLSMNMIEVSESYLDELKNMNDIEIIGSPYEIKFDKGGNMI